MKKKMKAKLPISGENVYAPRTCYECKGATEGRLENYTYTESGLKNIVLSKVLVYRCARCGAHQVEIPNMDGLHKCIALALLCKKTVLLGEEIRFLRDVAGFTATEFARRLAVTKQALSRWENGGKLGLASERAIRAVCGIAIIGEIVNEQSGAVDPKQVGQTLKSLQSFFKTLDGCGEDVVDRAVDSEKLTIDPRKPFSFGVLPPLSVQELASSVLQ